MSDVKWTHAQQCAINARGGPLIVSAAAGSGKTAVLSQRVIDIITDSEKPTDVDRFLIVTFTNLAAGEMKQRIAQKLDDLLKNDPFNKNLLRQQLLLAKAQISTIDGFCSALVKEYFYALDIPADFRIADEEEVHILKTRAINNVFERRYENDDQGFLYLVDMLSGSHDDSALQDIVLKLYDFIRSQPFPDRWINERLAAFDDVSDPAKTVWGAQIRQQAELYMEFITSQSRKAQTAVDLEPAFSGAAAIIANEADMIDSVNNALRSGTWNDICANFDDMTFKTMRFPAKINKQPLTDEQIAVRETVKACRGQYKDELKKLALLFAKDAQSFIDEINSLRPTVHAIFDLVQDFSSEYESLKRERSAADYGDLEHWALKLLVRDSDSGAVFTETAKSIASRFDYVMVDEYQDVNMLQETIFNAVSDNDRHLFVVGDVKQSVYRFRQAMPEIFIARKELSVPFDPELDNYPGKVNLDANFRSRKGVTDCVNFVFRCLMSRRMGELDYTDEEALTPKAPYPEDGKTAVSFHLIGTPDASGDDRTALEAEYIAGLIRRAMREEIVTDKSGARPAAYGDICIILRGANSVAPTYIKALMKQGIPAVSEKGDSFFSQPEIRLMLSLLRTIENPARDIPLAAALMSPIFRFTADEIAALHAANPNTAIYRALLDERESSEKAAYFCELFDELRECAGNMTSYDLINRIYERTLLPEIIMSGEDGAYRRKNLLLLLQYAKKYEESGFKGISGFLQFLDRLAESSRDLSAAERSGDSYENSVKIMTIHKSKGLEYPICIVAGLGKKFNDMDKRSDLVFHSKLGIGADVYNSDHMYSYKGITRKAVETAMDNEMISEELRLLYVAMTRAKERLILTAAVKDTEKTIKTAAKKLVYSGGKVSPLSVGSAQGFWEELIYCMLVSNSGEEFRSIADYGGEVCENDESAWNAVIVPDYRGAQSEDTADSESEDHAADEAEIADSAEDENAVAKSLEQIESRLSRRYRYAKECSIPVKAAASAIAERESGVLYGAESRPAFMDEGGLSSAERGTAMHNFAQHCDFEAARISIADEKRRLVEIGHLTQRQADGIDEKRMRVFLSSPLMDEMLTADVLEREYQFMTEIPAGLADPSLSKPFADELIVLQGAIDCLFIKDGDITIVDYKTDRAKTMGELAERYAPQLALYKYAAAQIFGKEPARVMIYSFALGEMIKVEV